MKILKDTLMVKGKFSEKRVQTFSAFWIATIYAFIPLFVPTFDVKEFVFIGFIGAGSWSLYRTQKKNENINYTHDGAEQ